MNTTTNEATRIVANYLEAHSKPNEGCLTIALACAGGGKNYQLHSKRLKNLLREQSTEWERQDLYSSTHKSIFDQGALLAEDGDRWSGEYEGVCLHLSDSEASLVKLPHAPREGCWAGQRLRLRPVAEALASQREMLVLNLSYKHPKLFCFDGQTATLCEDIDLPESVYSFSEGEVVDQGQRAHVRRSGGEGSPQMARQGVSHEQSPRDLNEPVFLREVKRILNSMEATRRVPLVIVGGESVVAEFLKVYEHAQGEVFDVTGEQSHPDEADIARICRRVCQDLYKESSSATLAELESADSNSELFSANVKEIVRAAESGRLAHCCVSRDAEIWLRRDGFDMLKSSDPTEEPEAFEALDLIFLEAVLKGNSVAVVGDGEVPGGKSVVAIFRW